MNRIIHLPVPYRLREAAGAGNGNSATLSPVKSAYDIAKEGGKHSGFLKQLGNYGHNQLRKAEVSLGRVADTHIDKIDNPGRYVTNWSELDPGYRARVLDNWQSEIDSAIAQIEIIRRHRHGR